MTKLLDQRIRQRSYIAVPPERVYDTITSAEEWNRFFTHSTELDPRPGGRMVFRWKDWGPDAYTTEAACTVLICDRPGRFVFQWYPVDKEHPTTIEFGLEPKHGGTVVTLTESGYRDTPRDMEMILECASGWGEAVTLLKFYLEHGVVYTPPKREG